MSSKRALVLDPKDNVAVAVDPIEAGDCVTIESKGGAHFFIEALEAIPFGFKLALVDIPKEGHILKHGEVMGRATVDIKIGTEVHVHNVQGIRAFAENEDGRKR
jgi:altronate dehydratase small subunit